MYIQHVALGGCLTAPAVRYGLTEDTGGHIAYVLGAARAQARRDDVTRVDIVTRAFDAPELGADFALAEQEIGPKLRILRLRTGMRGYLSKEALAAEIPRLTEAYISLLEGMPTRPDVIHAHFADAARLALAARDRFGGWVLYTPHSLGMEKMRHPASWRSPGMERRIDDERTALRRADAVVVSTRDEGEVQTAGYGVDLPGRLHRVPPGATLMRSADGARDGLARARALVDGPLADPSRPMVLAIARPVARKNLGGLLRAFAADPALCDRANLVILAGQHAEARGEGGEAARVVDDLARAARDPRLAGRVSLPAAHASDVVAHVYRLAARRRGVFVNPARHEPFGLTLLEAAQVGLPVIATRAGGPADILEAIGHGCLVDPADGADIARGIRALLLDADAWNAASAAGRAGVAAFDWDVWAARVARICAGLAVEGRTAPADRIVACDIDGTLTGDRGGAARFATWARRDRASGTLYAVATGRTISEARSVLAEWSLPEPDVFVTAVGTEIHRRDADGHLSLCDRYARHLERNWDRRAALTAMRDSGLELQPAIEQRRWKLAAFGTQADGDALRRALARAGVVARVVVSHRRLIDVLAPRGGKAAAVAFLAHTNGLTLADCVACGDSGNDLDMLDACGHGIVVANALAELVALPPRAGLYRSGRPHADGVLDGLARLGLAPAPTPVSRVHS